jgi:hypothetical protein
VILLALVWTAIKKDYRSFLNLGTGDQVVLVSREERINKLSKLITDLNSEKISKSTEALADRMTYVHFFGESIKVVPDLIPHENGLLWREAVENSLIPRVLNPGKKILNDSERTSYYTGGYVSGFQEGTSISLGYMAESYIDFGPILMFLPIFIWGLFCGFGYKKLLNSGQYKLYGFASATVLIYLNATLLESSNVKNVGGMVIGLISLSLLTRYLSPWLIAQLLTLSWRPFKRVRPKQLIDTILID